MCPASSEMAGNRNGIGNGNGIKEQQAWWGSKEGQQAEQAREAGGHLSWLRPQFLQHFASYISVLIRSKSCCAL